MIIITLISLSQVLTLLLSSVLSFIFLHPESILLSHIPRLTLVVLPKQFLSIPPGSVINSSVSCFSQSLSLSGFLSASTISHQLPSSKSSPGCYLHLQCLKSSLSYMDSLICAWYYLITFFRSFRYGYTWLLLSTLSVL